MRGALPLQLYILTTLLSTSGYPEMIKIRPGELNSGRLYTTCLFEEVKSNCFIDTGSTFSATADYEQFKGHPSTGKIQFQSAAGVPTEIDEIELESLTVDSKKLSGVRIARLNHLDGFESVLGIDAIGALPFNFLFHPIPFLNLGAKVPLKMHEGAKVYDKGVFSLPVELKGRNTQGLWDTGAELTSIDINEIESNPDNYSFVMDINNGMDATGYPVKMRLFKAKSIKIGPMLFRDINVLGINFKTVHQHIDPGISVIIGYNIITKANWHFDLASNKWLIE